MTAESNTPVNIHVDHQSVKKLGRWTSARSVAVRARRSAVVLDLRSPAIEAGDIILDLDLDHSLLKLLVPEGASVDQENLQWEGRGRLKDAYGHPAPGGRRIIVQGHSQSSEIRIHRNGVAILSAMFSREFLNDARNAYRNGTVPTVDDPSREPNQR